LQTQSFKPQRISLKESFATLKFVPRFFSEIRKVNPALFYTNLVARIISALLPVSMLWVGKLIIDEIVLQLNAEMQDMSQLWLFILLEFSLAIASDLLSRLTTHTDSLLGDQYSIESSVKIIKKTAELTLSQLEDSEFYDKLERARQQTTGRVGLMSYSHKVRTS
jgi:ATP-binding cassette subfamily B protein